MTITAKTKEEFEKAEALLKTLPENVFDQISNAHFGAIGLHCIIDKRDSEFKVHLPVGVTQISDCGDYVGIYTGDFFFKILNHKDKKINYSFHK
jgi:hypothetical protein